MEPKISVGILSADKIGFGFKGMYNCMGQSVEGWHTVHIGNGKIIWDGKPYTELLFEPQTLDHSFVVKDAVIGIDFHWQRKEDQEFRGALKLIVSNKMIRLVNLIGVEDYLTSVISSEMSATASLELLKAHAVISRSWLLAQIEKNKKLTATSKSYSTHFESSEELIRWYDREDHSDYDVCADDHCQRYQGITRISSNINTVIRAIAETKGQVLKSGGSICDARFSKCCGGATEEFQNCWEDISFPYLVKLRDSEDSCNIPDLGDEAGAEKWIRSRPAAYCDTRDQSVLSQILNNYDRETDDFYRWQVSYSQEELSRLVKERSGIDFGIIEDLIPLQRGTSGRIVRLKIVGSEKTMTIGKELEIRRVLSSSHLYSSAFVVDKSDGHFTLTGAGWGHGVGLCQIGAAIMGEKGYPYDHILLHYYKGAKIEKLY